MMDAGDRLGMKLQAAVDLGLRKSKRHYFSYESNVYIYAVENLDF